MGKSGCALSGSYKRNSSSRIFQNLYIKKIVASTYQIFDFEKIEGLTITDRKHDRLSRVVEVSEELSITIAMDIYVARQPIFDRSQKVIGYELLYRSGLTNSYDGAGGTEASLVVIRNTFLFLGERIVAPPRKVFIHELKDPTDILIFNCMTHRGYLM